MFLKEVRCMAHDRRTRAANGDGYKVRKGNPRPDPVGEKRELPEPDYQEGNRIRCRRCGRTLATNKFMRRAGKTMDICKDCVYSGCDNLRPESFKWVLERFDVPFLRDKWIEQTARAYFKDPKKFSSRSVIGTYIRTMGMKQYVDYGFADSESLTNWYQDEYGNPDIAGEPLWSPITTTDLECADDSNGRRVVDTVQSITPDTEQEDVSSAVMPMPNRESAAQVKQFQQRIEQENEKAYHAAKAHEEVEDRFNWGKDINAAENYPDTTKEVERDTLPAATVQPSFGEIPELPKSNFAANIAQMRVNSTQDPTEQAIKDQLTDEDIAMLGSRWGSSYLPSEWMQLEEMYERYEQEYDLNADRAEVLKKMCKVSLRMDQALENGETSEYKQLSSVYDQLRKSAKFTDAQKEEKKDKYLDSVGQLVAVLEREGGPIPAFDYKVEATQDIVDYTLRDMQKYTYSLVKKELGLGELIERYIAQLEESQKTQEELAKAADLGGITEVEASINDSFSEDIPDEELSIEDLIERDIEDMDEWG